MVVMAALGKFLSDLVNQSHGTGTPSPSFPALLDYPGSSCDHWEQGVTANVLLGCPSRLLLTVAGLFCLPLVWSYPGEAKV